MINIPHFIMRSNNIISEVRACQDSIRSVYAVLYGTQYIQCATWEYIIYTYLLTFTGSNKIRPAPIGQAFTSG